MYVYEQVFVTNFKCAEIGIVVLVVVAIVIVVPVIVVLVVVVIVIVVPVIILVLLVSAGLLKPIMAHAVSNRGYGMQTCHVHHC
jgi:hypothetical protein